MHKLFIGNDNGVSGAYSFIYSDKSASLFQTPTIRCLNYTKKVSYINRIDVVKLNELLSSHMEGYLTSDVLCGVERPMIMPGRFNATISAVRAFEATVIVLEQLEIPFEYIDSKTWAGQLLPSGVVGSAQLKEASKQVGIRLFPHLKKLIKKDADSLLIAEYLRQREAGAFKKKL